LLAGDCDDAQGAWIDDPGTVETHAFAWGLNSGLVSNETPVVLPARPR